MSVTLRDITNVSRVQEFGPETAVRAKHRHADLSFDHVLPFVSIGMPVQLAQCFRFEIENDARNRRRNWKAGGIDAPFPAAFEHTVWRLRKHSKFVCLWRRNSRTLEIFWDFFGRSRAAGKVNLPAWKAVKH